MCLWSIVAAVIGWGWAIFLYWQSAQLRRPLIVMEPIRSELKPGRVYVEVTIGNRGPWDIYVHSITLTEPDADMVIDAGGPVLFPGDTEDNRPTQSGRDLQLGMRLPAHASGPFPSGTFSFRIDGVTSITTRVCATLIMSRSIDASASASFKRCVSIQSMKA